MPRRPAGDAPRRRRAPRRYTRRPAAGYVSGRGAYTLTSLARRVPKSYYTHGGAMLGALGGSALNMTAPGAVIGRSIGAKVGEVVHGRGAYKVLRNTLITPDPPSIHNRGKEGMVQIRHREYVGDLKSSTGFDLQYQIPLNPALAQSFPWLAPIANQFTQWQPNGILVEFISTSGNALSSTNAALGEVVLSTQYDSVNTPFTNKQQMLAQEFAVSGAPSCNLIHPIECAARLSGQTNYYTRAGAVPTGADQRLYDLGVLCVATSGQQQAGFTLGEIWITYDILLMKPQLSDSADVYSESALLNFSASQPSGLFGSVPIVDPSSTLSLTTSGNLLTIPGGSTSGGRFEIDMFHAFASGISNTTSTSPAVANGSLITQMPVPGTATASTQLVNRFVVEIADPEVDTVVNFSSVYAGWSGTDPQDFTVAVSQVPEWFS